jgi:predicted GIY-YIG superfamily endonuclease
MRRRDHHYFVYMMASRTHVLYCGMTNSLDRRVSEHKAGTTPGFTADYRCERLVWFERYQYVRNAIAREKNQDLDPRQENRAHRRTKSIVVRSERTVREIEPQIPRLRSG